MLNLMIVENRGCPHAIASEPENLHFLKGATLTIIQRAGLKNLPKVLAFYYFTKSSGRDGSMAATA